MNEEALKAMPPFPGVPTPEYLQQCQNAADSAYARQIYWEACKIIFVDSIGKLERTISGKEGLEAVDTAVKEFKSRCESGFFDVKRQTGKGE